MPFQFRVRRRLARWLDVSLGFSYLAGSRRSSFVDHYAVTELGGETVDYVDSYDEYTVAAKGFLPSIGVHVGGKISPSLRLEMGFSGGPLFAECRYFIRYDSNVPWPGADGPEDVSHSGVLEEKGKGTAAAFHLGLKADYLLTRRSGVFVEGGYAFQSVRGVNGTGTRSETGQRDTWEGEWAMKQMVQVEPWGTGSLPLALERLGALRRGMVAGQGLQTRPVRASRPGSASSSDSEKAQGASMMTRSARRHSAEFALILVAAAVLTLGTSAFPAAPGQTAAVPGPKTGLIKGRVIDMETKAPLAGVAVSVAGTEHTSVSDTAGAYALPGVPLGYYSLVLRARGVLRGQSN